MRLGTAVIRLQLVALLLVGAAVPGGCQGSRLTGVWAISFTLDSANPLLPHPTARVVSGTLTFGTARADSAYEWRGDAALEIFGRSALDFTSFFDGRIASDISTSIAGRVDPGFTSEAVGVVGSGDTVRVELIPRISHGGVSLQGRLRQDTADGAWEQRAYCCGAHGHFVMRRISMTPPALTLPPRRPPPAPLDTTRLGKLRVRVLDRRSGKYVSLYYGLRFPSGAWVYGDYHAGIGVDGWSTGKWLAPGTYEVSFERFPCGSEEWFLRSPIREKVEVYAGRGAEVSAVVDLEKLEAAVAYNSPRGGSCPTR